MNMQMTKFFFFYQNIPAGGSLWAGGASDGRSADDRHEQT